MATKTSKRRFVCKDAKFLPTNEFTLQQLLAQALDELELASERREALGQDAQTARYRQILSFDVEDEFIFGVMATYEPGANTTALINDDAATQLSVVQVAPPVNDDGKRRHFLDGLLFFAVHENAVVLMQSMALRGRQFENHLNWLLQEAGVLDGLSQVALADKVPNNVAQQIRQSHVKLVTIGGQPLIEGTLREDEEDTGAEPPLDFAWGDEAIDVLKGVVGEVALSKLDLDDIGESNLQYSVTLSFHRNTTDKGQAVLDNLALALRNTNAHDTLVKLKDGTDLKGEQLKLAIEANVEVVSGVPNPTSIFTQMRRWVVTLIENKVI